MTDTPRCARCGQKDTGPCYLEKKHQELVCCNIASCADRVLAQRNRLAAAVRVALPFLADHRYDDPELESAVGECPP